jgi:molecular chaperone IbpA
MGLTYTRLSKETIMNSLARWERYSPVGIGLEDMFKRLDAMADTAASNYPPYNIVKIDDHTQELQIALAGIKKENITVAVERGVLTVSTKKGDEDLEMGTFLHKGIARRTFARNWQLSDQAIVDESRFVDGMLYVTVRLEVPEEQKRRVLPIS